MFKGTVILATSLGVQALQRSSAGQKRDRAFDTFSDDDTAELDRKLAKYSANQDVSTAQPPKLEIEEKKVEETVDDKEADNKEAEAAPQPGFLGRMWSSMPSMPSLPSLPGWFSSAPAEEEADRELGDNEEGPATKNNSKRPQRTNTERKFLDPEPQTRKEQEDYVRKQSEERAQQRETQLAVDKELFSLKDIKEPSQKVQKPQFPSDFLTKTTQETDKNDNDDDDDASSSSSSSSSSGSSSSSKSESDDNSKKATASKDDVDDWGEFYNRDVEERPIGVVSQPPRANTHFYFDDEKTGVLESSSDKEEHAASESDRDEYSQTDRDEYTSDSSTTSTRTGSGFGSGSSSSGGSDRDTSDGEDKIFPRDYNGKDHNGNYSD